MVLENKTKTGHTIEEASEEELKDMRRLYPYYDGLVKLQPGNWLSLSTMPKFLDKLYDFNFKPTDTLVLSYPKTGTTWTQEIVWTLINNPDLNNPMASLMIDMRSPHLEVDAVLGQTRSPKPESNSEFFQFLEKNAPYILKEDYKLLAYADWLPGARVFKSHLPLALLPPNALNTSKNIYIVRDPRDIIVSKYHFWRAIKIHSFQGTMDEFVTTMVNDEQVNHPFWEHIKLAFDLRDHPNLLFIYFEDLKSDPTKVITKISEFLGLDRSPEQIQNVVQYTNFQSMKKRTEEGKAAIPMSGGDDKFYNKSEELNNGTVFYRSGKSGDWRRSFTDDQVSKISKWMESNLEKFPSDFKYKAS